MKRSFLPVAVFTVVLVISAPNKMKAEPGWVMPRAPYPIAAIRKHEQGILKLKVTTNATGKVAKVVVSVPANQGEIPDLALMCERWALAKWSGPPNRVLRTQVQYFLR